MGVAELLARSHWRPVNVAGGRWGNLGRRSGNQQNAERGHKGLSHFYLHKMTSGRIDATPDARNLTVGTLSDDLLCALYVGGLGTRTIKYRSGHHGPTYLASSA